MFRKILAATDGSNSAMVAVSHAAALAQRVGSELLVATAYESSRGRSDRSATAAETNLEIARAILRDTTQLLDDHLRVNTAAVQGSPGDALARLAVREGCDLVVIGNRGVAPRRSLPHRSVPERVLHLAPTHVLLVRTNDSVEPTFRHFLVGTDGSPTANRSVALATALASALGAMVSVATVAASEEEGRRVLDSARDGYSFADELVLFGDPATSIAEASKRSTYDLVVVGNKGLTGRRRYFLGSVPETLCRTAATNLIIAKTSGGQVKEPG